MAKTEIGGESIKDGSLTVDDMEAGLAADIAAGAAAGDAAAAATTAADAATAAATDATTAAEAATAAATDAATAAATAETDAQTAITNAAAAQAAADAAAAAVGTIAENEVPAGTINGINTDFTIANSAAAYPTSLKVWKDGIRVALTDDYTFDGTTGISFLVAPLNHVIVDYRY